MSKTQKQSAPRRTAGLGDIRVIIGGLIGIYGVILTIMGIAGGKAATANLWAGIGMLAGCAVFLLWNFLSPTVMDEVDAPGGQPAPASPASPTSGDDAD